LNSIRGDQFINPQRVSIRILIPHPLRLTTLHRMDRTMMERTHRRAAASSAVDDEATFERHYSVEE